MSDERGAGYGRIPSRTWKIAAVAGAGAFMAMLDSTVVNLALESIRADFASTLSVVQWIATGYLIALAVSLPAAAWLGNRHGQGRVWAWSLAVFVGASAACAVAPSPPLLVAARVVQGLAGGLMIPAGQAVIGSSAGPRELGRIMGTLGLVIALGPAIGPVIGGGILDVSSWRWLFWINVPIGVATLIAARGLVPVGTTAAARPLDRRGLLLLGVGLPLFLYGAMELGASGVAPSTVPALVVGSLLAAGFVASAVRSRNPLIDLRLLRRKTFAAATAITGLTGANMYGGLLILPLYLQFAMGQDIMATGFFLLAMGLGSALALPVGGTLTDRYGAGPVAATGACLLLATTLPFLAPTAPTPSGLALVLVARGVGLALGQMPAVAAAYGSAGAEEMGDASALVNVVQRVGGAIGAGGAVVLLARTGMRTSATAYMPVFAALTLLAAFTLVPALALWRQPR